MPEQRTALVVTVPEAEPAVGAWRAALDPVTALGVPAHVSVLFPFVAASGVDDTLCRRLAQLLAAVPAFDFRLVRTAWFGADVLWLEPEPGEAFRSLTELVWREYPAYPPYGGQFDEVVPHLTVADRAGPDRMREAERAVRLHLPIRGRAEAVALMREQPSGIWSCAASFALGAVDEPGTPGRPAP